MSSERAGTPTHGHLDREAAQAAVETYDAKFDSIEAPSLYPGEPGEWMRDLLNTLEACVVPDPRITRIEALCDEWAGSTRSRITPDCAAREVRAALRGDE